MEKRFFGLDFWRGIAVMMMVVFHFVWDLNYFGVLGQDPYLGFWGVFQKLTAGAFLFLSGTTLAISYNKNTENFVKKFFKKSARIFLFAFTITLFTLAFFPEQPVFFGILHLIALGTLLAIPLVSKKNLALALGILLVFLPVFFDFSALGIEPLFFAGLSEALPALDFFPLIPWFGAMLLGIFFGSSFYGKGKQEIGIEIPKNALTEKTVFLGKHSLFVYFVHQPVLFAVFFAAILAGVF